MYVDKTKRYGYSFLAFVQDALWYNSDLVKPEELRSLDDLCIPSGKARLATAIRGAAALDKVTGLSCGKPRVKNF